MIPRSVCVLSISMALTGLSGCLYTNIRTPWAYRAATPSEVKSASTDVSVMGKSCDEELLYLVAWGNSGYAAAVKAALADQPPGSILYDVKTDLHVRSVLLGLYTRTCTVITAKVGKL